MQKVPYFTNEAHCKRVAGLAREIGIRLKVDPFAMGYLEPAALLHHEPFCLTRRTGSQRLIDDLAATGLFSGGRSRPVASTEVMRILRAFHEVESEDAGEASLLGGVLRLANAFDESYEWLSFEAQEGSSVLREMDTLGAMNIWPVEASAAFVSLSAGNIQRALAKAERLPVSTVAKVNRLATLGPDELTIDGLEQIALGDPVLSADLLRSANSARFRRVQSVGRVRDALGLMGVLEAKDVMLASAARSLFASSNLRELWKHSVQSAVRARSLARAARLSAEQAFVNGLLHDIGRVAMELLDYETNQMRARLRETNAPAIWIEIANVGCDHAELGATMLGKWNLPDEMVEAIRFHHHPELGGPQAALLYVVESLENTNEDLPSEFRWNQALGAIGLTGVQVESATDLASDLLGIAC